MFDDWFVRDKIIQILDQHSPKMADELLKVGVKFHLKMFNSDRQMSKFFKALSKYVDFNDTTADELQYIAEHMVLACSLRLLAYEGMIVQKGDVYFSNQKQHKKK